MSEELMPWHQNYLVNIDYNRVDLVKEGANSKAHIKLFKSKGGNTMNFDELLTKLQPEHAQIITDVIKSKDDAIADIQGKLDAEIEKSKNVPAAPVAGQSEEEILKSVKDPAVKALLETQIAKAKAAEDLVRKAREEKLDAEAIAKAKEVPGIGAEEAKMAEVYKKLKTVDATLCEDVFGIFKSASALVNQSGAFQEIGKSAGEGASTTVGASDEATAWDAIEKAAEPIAKSKGINLANAVSEVIKTRPELYEAYLKAQRGE